MTFVHRYDVIV